MKTKLISIALGVGLLAAAPVWAESNAQLIARMEKLAADCQWKLTTASGGPKGKLTLHHRQMENIIDQLKAGKSVDAKTIDAVLHDHYYG
ncbi:MAG TPA: hypothetical protein VL754_07430 [Verrucomicrobiae bacterium]|jgi:hypothetical protein|nr:hypothetical protein [Verrucomicrobiae bacterium]